MPSCVLSGTHARSKKWRKKRGRKNNVAIGCVRGFQQHTRRQHIKALSTYLAELVSFRSCMSRGAKIFVVLPLSPWCSHAHTLRSPRQSFERKDLLSKRFEHDIVWDVKLLSNLKIQRVKWVYQGHRRTSIGLTQAQGRQIFEPHTSTSVVQHPSKKPLRHPTSCRTCKLPIQRLNF